jgi:hypothetical protein
MTKSFGNVSQSSPIPLHPSQSSPPRYPEANPERQHSRADLEALISELWQSLSLSRTQFAKFYLSFFLISTFLI